MTITVHSARPKTGQQVELEQSLVKMWWICGVVVVVFTVFVDVGDGFTATGPKHGKLVVCYIGSWAVYRPDRGSFAIEHIDPSLCTHLIYSFAGLNATTFTMRSLDPWQDLTDNFGKGGYNRMTMLKSRYPHLKVSLAIGGWNEGSANYSAMAASATRRSRFISSAVDFIKKYNFDGLDLDWEFPGKRGGAPEDKDNFLLLVKELRAAFSKYNFLLTAALGAGKDTIDVAYDMKGLSLYLDYIHLMCYDYHGAWDMKTGANAPLRSNDVLNVEFTVQYAIKLGASRKKLVLGLPLYGRTFKLQEELPENRKPKLGAVAHNVGFSGPYTRENGFMGYNEICVELKNTTQWQQFWDDESQTPFAVSGEKVIAFDNERSLHEKVRFALENDLAGAMVWSVDTDDFRGDCADVATSDDQINFPLMHAINKAIVDVLEDMEKNKENVIPHGEDKKEEIAAGARFGVSGALVVVFTLVVICYF